MGPVESRNVRGVPGAGEGEPEQRDGETPDAAQYVSVTARGRVREKEDKPDKREEEPRLGADHSQLRTVALNEPSLQGDKEAEHDYYAGEN